MERMKTVAGLDNGVQKPFTVGPEQREWLKQDLAGLINLDPQRLARLMRGEILKDRPYATIQWVLRLAPFRPLEIYLLFDYEEEFGHNLHVLYAPKSLVVPTEDAYVFAWSNIRSFTFLLGRPSAP